MAERLWQEGIYVVGFQLPGCAGRSGKDSCPDVGGPIPRGTVERAVAAFATVGRRTGSDSVRRDLVRREGKG